MLWLGKPRTPNCGERELVEIRAARAKLRELSRIEDSAMLLIAESLGGAIVVELAGESALRGLILQSTFSSQRKVADVHYPKLSWLAPPDKRVPSSPGPRRAADIEVRRAPKWSFGFRGGRAS